MDMLANSVVHLRKCSWFGVAGLALVFVVTELSVAQDAQRGGLFRSSPGLPRRNR